MLAQHPRLPENGCEKKSSLHDICHDDWDVPESRADDTDDEAKQECVKRECQDTKWKQQQIRGHRNFEICQDSNHNNHVVHKKNQVLPNEAQNMYRERKLDLLD